MHHSLLELLETRRISPAVQYDEKRKALVAGDGQVFRGVCPTIHSLFFPHYKYRPIETTAMAPSPPQVSLVPLPPLLSGRVAPKVPTRPPTGLETGVRVDQELTKAIREIVRNGGNVRSYLTGLFKRPKQERIHHRTRSILRWLVEMGYRPVAAQLPVSSTKGRVATLVDIVCYDQKTNRFILIETKSGFDDYYDTGSGCQLQGSASFLKRSDSPRNQHQLQLLATSLLFCATFKFSLTSIDAKVVRITDSCLYTYPLSAWAIEGTKAVASLL